MIDSTGIELLKRIGDVTVYSKDQPIPRTELLEAIGGKDAVLTLLTDQVDAAFFAAAGPSLRIVANHAVGYDNIDLAEADRRGIVVTNTPALSAQFVAEHALGLMLAVCRRIVEGDQFVRAGQFTAWAPLAFLGQSLWNRTLGIVGCGQIGSWTAQLAHRAFNMRILYTDVVRNQDLEATLGAERHELDVLLRRADVVSLHVPLLPATHHLIGAHQLKLMKETAILINTARGPVVDEQALYRALADRRIFGAGLDVFEREPLVYRGLEKLPNVVLTPHIASATPEARRLMAEMAAGNVAAVLRGRPPLNPVKPD